MSHIRVARARRSSRASAARAASTFEPGLRLLPRDLEVDARKLYGLLRTVDDLVDECDPEAAARVGAMERWANGEPADTPETRTLSQLVQRHPFPPAAILEFCEGMRHDLAGETLTTEADLERYCQQVGGAIGVILARMFGSADPGCGERMAMLGRAFQRTNILRDIDEDHAHGRLYVAKRTIERFGFPTPGAREALLRDQIARADRLYDEGLGAIPLLPRGGRSMAVSVSLYREILRQIERDGYGHRSGRVTVPGWRMRLLVSRHRLKSTYA
ncbi:MAG TPA: phytoene/squalene synthase family protein [Solirubrobacteraceae bacterium]|nr:phytoene/squalene synthase family protein [Solirubrobacteraceae bacterium]